MKTHEIRPCRHVSRYVEAAASGKPTQWWQFIALLHVRNCPKCQEALELLRKTLETVKNRPPAQVTNDDVSNLEKRIEKTLADLP